MSIIHVNAGALIKTQSSFLRMTCTYKKKYLASPFMIQTRNFPKFYIKYLRDFGKSFIKSDYIFIMKVKGQDYIVNVP